MDISKFLLCRNLQIQNLYRFWWRFRFEDQPFKMWVFSLFIDWRVVWIKFIWANNFLWSETVKKATKNLNLRVLNSFWPIKIICCKKFNSYNSSVNGKGKYILRGWSSKSIKILDLQVTPESLFYII